MTESIEKKINQLGLNDIVELNYSKGEYSINLVDEAKIKELDLYIQKANVEIDKKRENK